MNMPFFNRDTLNKKWGEPYYLGCPNCLNITSFGRAKYGFKPKLVCKTCGWTGESEELIRGSAGHIKSIKLLYTKILNGKYKKKKYIQRK
jgi:hypothetical protein